MTAHTKVIPAREARDRADRLVSDLENQLRNAIAVSQVGRAAVRVLPVAGAAIAVASNVEASIRVSRLEGELANAKRSLETAVDRFE